MAQTQLEKAFEAIINVYHQYSVRVGHFDTLTKGELRQLIEKELPTFLKEQKNPQAIEKIFTDLDKNKDKQISFGEFMDLVVKVVIAAHENIHKEGDDGHAHHHHH